MESNLEFKKKLEKRTEAFAVGTFRLIDALPQTMSSRVVAWQLGKSASSIGANYREANRAESKPDFIHKLGIVMKETSESEYWLTILHELYPENDQVVTLHAESNELVRLFFSILRTSKLNCQPISGT